MFHSWLMRAKSPPSSVPHGTPVQGGALEVVVADLHINSTVALCPLRVRRDAGGTYYRSEQQDWLAEKWTELWDQVEAEKKASGLPLYVVYLGDVCDKNQHSRTELIEYESNVVILQMCVEVLERPLNLADRTFVVRGTEAHTGSSGYIEEHLARQVGAEPDPDGGGRVSWWHLCQEVAGIKTDLCHHAQTYARRPWTAGAGAARQAAITCDEYDDLGEGRPQLVGRAHGHYAAMGYKSKTFCFYCPPWQLSTPFARRLGAGRRVEPPGAWMFWLTGQVPVRWRLIDFPVPRGAIWRP